MISLSSITATQHHFWIQVDILHLQIEHVIATGDCKADKDNPSHTHAHPRYSNLNTTSFQKSCNNTSVYVSYNKACKLCYSYIPLQGGYHCYYTSPRQSRGLRLRRV